MGKPDDHGTELEPFLEEPTWDDIQNLIDTNDVIVFAASWCGYSRGAKHYLNKLDVPYVYMDIDKTHKNHPKKMASFEQHILSLFMKHTKMRSTPRIFIKGQDIKGYTDMTRLGISGKRPQGGAH